MAKTKAWGMVFRAGVSVALLGLALWLVPLEPFFDALSRVAPSTVALVVLALCMGHLCAAIKWWVLLGRSIPVRAAIGAHCAGLGANLALPGAVGGDVLRGGLAMSAGASARQAMAGGFADRAVDMVALGAMALGGMALTGVAPEGSAGWVFAAAIGVAVLSAALVYRVARRMVGRAGGLSMRLAMLSDVDATPVTLLGILLISVVVQTALVGAVDMLAGTLGVSVSFGAWLMAWPVAKVLSALPLSLGGLGVREGTLALLLTPFGAAPAAVIATSLVWQMGIYITGGVATLLWTALRPGR